MVAVFSRTRTWHLVLLAAVAAASSAMLVPQKRDTAPAPPQIIEPTSRVTCEVIDYGIYTADEEKTRYSDPGSVTGERFEVDSIRFTDQTHIIPLQLGRGFGMGFRLHGLPEDQAITISRRVVYPSLIHGATGWDHVTSDYVFGGQLEQHLLYDFVYDWEMVSGPWRFQITVNGEPACSFTFDVR